MACGRGFNSPQLHQYPKSQPSSVGIFLPVPPVLARFSRQASRAPPQRSRRFRPCRHLSVLRFLWRSRERSRGHFLCWRGFRGGRLWLAAPVPVATQDGRPVGRYAVGCSRPGAAGRGSRGSGSRRCRGGTPAGRPAPSARTREHAGGGQELGEKNSWPCGVAAACSSQCACACGRPAYPQPAAAARPRGAGVASSLRLVSPIG